MSDFPPNQPPGFDQSFFGAPMTPAPPAKGRRRDKSAPKSPKAPKPQRAKKERADRPPTRRAANSHRTIGLLFAVVAIALVALALTSKPTQTFVVQAAQPIGSLQPYAAAEMKAVPMPSSAIQSGAITAKSASAALASANQQFGHEVTQYPIAAGQQITAALFSGSSTVSQVLPTGDRLFAIQADIGALAEGIRVGNYVDVVAVASGNSANGSLAGVVLSHVKVAAIEPPASTLQSAASSASAKLPASSVGGTYVLEIPSDQETRLAVVAGSGSTLYLTYSPPSATTPNAAVASVLATICGTNDPAHSSGSVAVVPAACR